jgi:hypothetical protein
VEPARELGARAHAELGVDVGQVARYRPLAEEQCGRDFAVGSTLGNQRRDAALGRRQPRLAPAPGDAAELGARFCRPQGGADRLEPFDSRLDRLAGSLFLAAATPERAKRQEYPRAPERIADRLILGERPPE